MGSLVDFDALRARDSARRRRAPDAGEPARTAEILFFLGVRYERHDGETGRTRPGDPNGRGGRDGSRRG